MSLGYMITCIWFAAASSFGFGVYFESSYIGWAIFYAYCFAIAMMDSLISARKSK